MWRLTAMYLKEPDVSDGTCPLPCLPVTEYMKEYMPLRSIGRAQFWGLSKVSWSLDRRSWRQASRGSELGTVPWEWGELQFRLLSLVSPLWCHMLTRPEIVQNPLLAMIIFSKFLQVGTVLLCMCTYVILWLHSISLLYSVFQKEMEKTT
jgi:hypothetical protein